MAPVRRESVRSHSSGASMSGRMVAPRAGTSDNSFRPKRSEGPQMTKVDTGVCEVCGQSFNYLLIHNGFGDTAYAYCDKCGRTAFVSGWSKNIPVAAKLKLHGPVNPEAEALLAPCSCGGAFRAGATPRCPHCGVHYPPSWLPSILKPTRRVRLRDGDGSDRGRGSMRSSLTVTRRKTRGA
jgi:hypothetical protein